MPVGSGYDNSLLSSRKDIANGEMLISSLSASVDFLRSSPSLMTAYERHISECKHLDSVKYWQTSLQQNKLVMLMRQIKMLELIKKRKSPEPFLQLVNTASILFPSKKFMPFFFRCICCWFSFFSFKSEKLCHHKLVAELKKINIAVCFEEITV